MAIEKVRVGRLLASPLEITAFKLRNTEDGTFTPVEFRVHWGGEQRADMGLEMAKLFCRFVDQTLQGDERKGWIVDTKSSEAAPALPVEGEK